MVVAPGHGSIPLWSSLALHFPEIAHFHIFLNLEQLRCKGPGSHLGLQRAPPPAPNPRSGPALQTLNMNEQWEKEAFAAVGGN